ncbi:PREDICTED: lymphatic vessel endothelial hyaluronic acid receptor 1 isoform X2 [Poecilia mexicana]|uniref:lymphatic vessel endothelial hyaluronic acid receptor 1 isoform X2 n=1 Tax=Poecilia mexicana TaxID=48701 RepID=UPI00072DA8D5|nr:PREDICTED: lymphatic vessel endothelial hyaluronic acid receptor 1 isoform X2 [Poecilia mexicana]
MNIIWVCISSLLAFSSVFSDQNTSNIKVFPAANQSTAGVTQVSYQNNQNQLQYAFNASEARKICQSLGLSIASKAQVEEALSRGLETCRYGWTDEQIAVIPRIHALANCGQNKTGLVLWRAPVTNRFDVFCFNESAKVVLISCICGLLFTIISLVAYLKLGRHCHLRSDEKQQQQQQQDYTQTEEWISVKTIAETTKEVQQDQRIDVDDGEE